MTTHPDIAHLSGNPRSPSMKGIPCFLFVGKGLGVCSKGVLKQSNLNTNPRKVIGGFWKTRGD